MKAYFRDWMQFIGMKHFVGGIVLLAICIFMTLLVLFVPSFGNMPYPFLKITIKELWLPYGLLIVLIPLVMSFCLEMIGVDVEREIKRRRRKK